MKAIKIVDPIEVVEWDGSQKAYRKIVEMCPENQGVSMKDGVLTILHVEHGYETKVKLGDVVLVEDGEMDALSHSCFYWEYQIMEE